MIVTSPGGRLRTDIEQARATYKQYLRFIICKANDLPIRNIHCRQISHEKN